MEPIIDPSIFYWINVMNNIKLPFALFTAASLVTIIFCGVALLLNAFDLEENKRKAKKILKLSIIIFLICLLLLVFLPTKETCITMLVAQQITPDNLNLANTTLEETMTSIKDFIIEITQAINSSAAAA